MRRVTASELDIIVLAADDDNAVVLTWDELGVQTVELRRITERPYTPTQPSKESES